MRPAAKGFLVVAGVGGAYVSARMALCHYIGVAADFSARINDAVDQTAPSAVITRSRSTSPPRRLQSDIEIQTSIGSEQVIDLREGADA